MDTEEYTDVLPLGFIDGRLTAGQRLALARSGAIPASYVRERAQITVLTGVLAGAITTLLYTLWVYGSGMSYALTLSA